MRYTVPLEVDDPLAVPSNRKGYIAPGSLVDDKCSYDYNIMGRHKYKLIFIQTAASVISLKDPQSTFLI